MNEQAIIDSYNIAVQNGYKKSIDEFKSLLSTNSKALNDVYNLAVKNGYSKTLDDYKVLMGVSASPADITEQPKKKEDTTGLPSGVGSSASSVSAPDDKIKALFKKYAEESSLRETFADRIIPTTPATNPEFKKALKEVSIRIEKEDAELAQAKLSAENEFDKLGEKPRIEQSKYLNEQLTQINKDLIGKGEEYVVPEMQYRFGNLGFKFEEAEGGRDYMNVTASNGKTTQISLDNFLESTSASEAFRLQKFIQDNTPVKGLFAFEKTLRDQDKVFNNQKEIDESLASINSEQANIMARKYEFVKIQSSLEAEKANLESVPEKQRNTPEYIAKVNDFISRADKFSSDLQTFEKDIESLKNKEQQLNTSIGKYTEMKAQQGTWYGAGLNAFANKSYYDMAKGLTGVTIDFIGEVISATGLPIMSQENYEKNFIEQAKKEGININEGEDFISITSRLSPETLANIENRVKDVGKKSVKGEVIGDLDKTSKMIMESSGVSPEYYQSVEETFVGGALLGALTSIPAMAGGPLTRTVLMGSQVLSGLDAEMANDPAFADISENEKYLVKGPIAVAVATLESIGLSNLINQKGFLNGLVLKALGKVGKGASYKTFGEAIKNEIDSAVARGALTLGAGFLAEAETGALQEVADISIKEIYNMAKEKEMFDTPDSVVQFIERVGKASIQEGIGAGVISIPASVSAAYSGKGFLEMDDNQFMLFEKIANDSNIKKGFIATLKSRINSGEITAAEGKDILNNYTNSVGILNSLPNNLDIQGKKQAMNLLKERRELELQISGKDQALTAPQRNRITQINEQLTKLSEDAVQKQAAGQVPVQPEARVGQEVAQGEPQAEPQGVTQEGQKEIADENVILSGLRDGFKAVTRNSFDIRSDADVMQNIENRKSFTTSVTKNGKKYLVVGLKLKDVEATTSGRDGYSFAAIEDDGNLPSNAVDVLTQKAVSNVSSVYPNIKTPTIDMFAPVEGKQEVIPASIQSDVDKINEARKKELDDFKGPLNQPYFIGDETGPTVEEFINQKYDTQIKELKDKATPKKGQIQEGGLTQEIKRILPEQTDLTDKEKQVLNNLSSTENISLDEAEKIFRGYKVNDYSKFNNLLRRGLPITKENLIKEGVKNEELATLLEEDYNNLSRVLSNSTFSPQEQTTLYRVMFDGKNILDEYNEGDIISDKSFASTTIDENWVKDANRPMIKFELEKGDQINGFYAGGVEKEFIINKNTEFVVKKKEVIDGNTVLTVSLPKPQAQEEIVTPQQIEKQRADLDMEVKALEELLDDPNQEPLFKKSDNDTKFGESADVVEDVVRQINELPSGNVTTTITPKPQKPIDIDDLESRADVPVKRTTFDVIKGIPAVFSISDQLRIGNVTNPNTGNVIDRLFGGLGFGFTKGHEGFAWANTTKDEAQSLVDRAVSVYNNNKALFDDWWSNNPEYNGLVPLNIAKMAEGSIMSNEALYRVIKDNFASFPKKNKVDALNYLTKNRIPSIIYSLNNSLKNPNLAKNARKSVEKRIKSLTSIQDKIKSGKVNSIDQLLDPSFYLELSLPVRAELISQLTTGSPNKPGEKKASGLPGKNTVPRALLGIDQDASLSAKAIGEANLNKVSLSNAVETITEPSMRDVEPRQIIAIYGIDVLNPAVKETVHPNYKFGVNGRPIGVLENSVSIQEAYPFAYTNILESLISQEEKTGAELKAAPIESLINENIPVGIGLPNLEFIGAISQGVMSNAQKLSAWINKSFPSVIMSTDAETFANVLNSEGVRVQLKGDEVVYGVTVDGDIYINPDVHNSDSALFNTTIHEFGHVWLNFLETTAEGRTLLNRGVDLVKKTGEYQDQLKKFNGNQNKAANEALAILIGNRGETIVNASLKSKFQEWLLGMWKYVKDKFKLSGDLTPQEIQDLTLDQFLGTAIADLFSGKALPVGDIQLKKLKNPEAAFSKSDSIDSIVQRGRANGFSEESIKIVLQKRGFTQEAIDAALAKAEPAAKKVEVTEEFAPGYDRVLNEIFGKDGIVDKSRRRGRSEEDTLKNAIDYLQQDTKVYENATDVQREAMVRNLRKEFKKREKAAPSAEKVVEGPKKKVTVDEMAALKDQIKLEARAAREAKGDLNTKRKALAAAINKLAKDGKITAKKAEIIAKRALTINLDSEVAVNKFVDYVSKVFADADYASKLSNGNAIRAKIRSASKNKDKSANLRDLGVKFSEIDPSMVEDIDQYNEIASKILKSIEGSSLRSGVKFAEIVKIADVSDYINTTIDKQRKEILKGKIDEMSELLGIEITEEEYFKIIESINNNEPLPKKYKDGAIRKAIDRAFNVYSAIIDDIFKTGKDPVTGEEVSISDKKKKVVKDFMSMDLNLLSDKEALAAIDSLLNFIQNKSTAKMSAIYNRNLGEKNAIKLDKKGFKSFKLKKYFSPRLAKVLVEQFTQLDLAIERMFKGFNKAGDFMFEAGISALKKGKSLAQSLNNKIVDNYFNTFYKSKPNGQAFNTIFNTVERGMTAYMMRTMPGTEAEINAEFKKKKSLIEQSIDTLNKGNDKQRELASVYTEVYDKLVKGSENYDDVVSKADPKNVEAVRFWQNEWANKYEDLSDLSESIYNKTLGRDLNYTPVRVSNTGDGPSIDENSDEMNRYAMSFHINNQTTYQRETGVLMTPTLDDKLSKGTFIDLSFDRNNANSMYDALIDLNTADAVRQIAGFFNSDSFENIIQNGDDRGILKGRVNLFIRNIRNKNPYDNDEFAKAIRGLQNLAALGAGRALAGPTQALKQTIPVIVNTVVNAGSIDLAAPFNKDKNDFINNSGYAIANRSAASINQIESINKLAEKAAKSFPSKVVDPLIDPLLQLNELQLKLFLQKPDSYVARASWMSYYEKSLRQQGIDTKSIDYATHQINDKAADYAQRMVDRQQNLSDMDLAGKFVGSKNPIAQFVNKTVMPFSSFRINQSARLGSDWAVLTSKVSTTEDRVVAARSLGGFFSEMVTFRAMSATIAVVLASVASLISGREDDEEDREKLFDMIIKNATTSSIIDIVSFLPYMDDIFQAGIATSLDVVQDMLEVEDADKFPFYDPKDKSWVEGLGMLGITGQRTKDLINLIDVAYTRDYKDDFGRTKYITEEDADILKNFVLLNILSSVGIASPEIKTMTRRTLANVKRRSSTNESGIKREKGSGTRSSGSGAPKTINKTDMKKYFPDMYNELYGPGSPTYEVEQEVKAFEKEQRKMEEQIKKEIYGGR